jgi:hypothetical protein
MRKMLAAGLVAMGGMLAGAPAQADWVSSFKGNDTGGIIAWELAHGYISFACRWVPYGANDRPLSVKY